MVHFLVYFSNKLFNLMEFLSVCLINWLNEGQESKAAKLSPEMAAEIHRNGHRSEVRRL